MAEDLRTLAAAAVRTAAERLGVDPHRLARFLGEGRLADVLEALARPAAMHPLKVVGLAETYLEFLEKEIEIQEGSRPNGSRGRRV
jgi:hypothetical protein